MTQQTKPVLEAIAKVMADTGSVQKRGKNEFYHYAYATASDIANVLQKTMATHGLVIIQHEKERQFSHNDSVLLVSYEFTLAHVGGDVWSEKIVQSAMCSAKNTKGGIDDKALNKCHTAARKYFVLGLFFIPTGDYQDADAGEDAPPPTEQHHEDIPVSAKHRLVGLCGSKEYELILRDYLRAVPSKSGVYGLQPDQELSDLSPELVAYIVSNWTKVKTAVDTWANSVPGAEMSDAPQSSWRDYKIHFSTKKYPTIKGMTMGEAWDNKDTHGWVIGTLLGFTAKGYQGKPPSPEDLALEAVCKQWRKDNGKPEPTEEQ